MYNCTYNSIYIIAPVRLHGEGSYAITDVKEITVSDDFLGLDETIRKCQNIEPLENCTTRQYLDIVKKQCKCVPFALHTFGIWLGSRDSTNIGV